MKVDDTQTDRHGRTMIVFSGVRKFSEVYDWLFDHYNGYKFGIVLDCSQSERAEPDNNIYVYFLDEMAEEIMVEYGYNYDPKSDSYTHR